VSYYRKSIQTAYSMIHMPLLWAVDSMIYIDCRSENIFWAGSDWKGTVFGNPFASLIATFIIMSNSMSYPPFTVFVTNRNTVNLRYFLCQYDNTSVSKWRIWHGITLWAVDSMIYIDCRSENICWAGSDWKGTVFGNPFASLIATFIIMSSRFHDICSLSLSLSLSQPMVDSMIYALSLSLSLNQW